jgi:hypothetical protein
VHDPWQVRTSLGPIFLTENRHHDLERLQWVDASVAHVRVRLGVASGSLPPVSAPGKL